jgi:hypothetical protein
MRAPFPNATFQVAQRTGPIGRVARLALATAYAVTLGSIVDPRLSARFRNPHILTEPGAWILHVVMFITFILLVGALAGAATKRTWQVAALGLSALTVALAALVGILTHGSAWGFPLADIVWWFDVVMLVEGFIATIVATALRTPACEIGVWRELAARARGGSSPPEHGLDCIVGLHLLDAWEARRSPHSAGA